MVPLWRMAGSTHADMWGQRRCGPRVVRALSRSAVCRRWLVCTGTGAVREGLFRARSSQLGLLLDTLIRHRWSRLCPGQGPGFVLAARVPCLGLFRF